MRFDDDWSRSRTLDAFSIDDGEPRYDRVARVTVICTDIVGGARLFEALPRAEFDALLADYLEHVRGIFGREHIHHTLRDDIFLAFEGEAPEALALALGFVGRMHRTPAALPFQCSVGICCGDVAIVTRGQAVEAQGPPVAIAKGLAKLAAARAVFVDEPSARALDAARHHALTDPRVLHVPHVGRALAVCELLGDEGERGLKERFLRPAASASLGAALRV